MKKALLAIFSVMLASCIHVQVDAGKNKKTFFQKKDLYNSIVKVENSLSFTICDINEEGEKENCKDKVSEYSMGSGFAIGDGNSIGTAGHICQLSQSQKVRIKIQAIMFGKWIENIEIESFRVISDDGMKVNASLKAVNRKLDACVLRAKGMALPPLEIASRPPTRGKRYYSAGAPLGINGKEMTYLTSGLYSGTKETRGKEMDWYSLPSAGGSSGSAILNEHGKIVGLISLGIPRFKEVSISPQFSQVHFFFSNNM